MDLVRSKMMGERVAGEQRKARIDGMTCARENRVHDNQYMGYAATCWKQAFDEELDRMFKFDIVNNGHNTMVSYHDAYMTHYAVTLNTDYELDGDTVKVDPAGGDVRYEKIMDARHNSLRAAIDKIPPVRFHDAEIAHQKRTDAAAPMRRAASFTLGEFHADVSATSPRQENDRPNEATQHRASSAAQLDEYRERSNAGFYVLFTAECDSKLASWVKPAEYHVAVLNKMWDGQRYVNEQGEAWRYTIARELTKSGEPLEVVLLA